MTRVLVLHPGALGDIILSLPALGFLRAALPTAEITIAGNVDFLDVVAHSYADRVVSISTLPLHRLHGKDPVPKDDVRFWRSFDRIISWTGAGDNDFTRNLKRTNPAARIVPWRPGADESSHVACIFMESLRPWFLLPGNVPPARIVLSEENRGRGEMWLLQSGWHPGEPLVALHPGAGSGHKRWPALRFQTLASEIERKFARKIVLIEGPAEAGLAGEIARGLQCAAPIVADCVPLGTLAGALSHCQVFVGNDSGVSHLAAGLGIPTVVLFGPTSPEQWAPRGENVVSLRDIRGCEACACGTGSVHTCVQNISVESCLFSLRRFIEGPR